MMAGRVDMIGVNMRWILSLLAMVALGLSSAAKAQYAPGVLEKVQGKGGTSLDVTSVLLFGRCKVILPGWDWSGGWRTFLHERSSWDGPCDEHGLADGTGALILCQQSNVGNKNLYCTRFDGTIVKGLFQGQ